MAASDHSRDLLQSRIEQQEIVSELGRRALETEDLDALVADVTRSINEALETDRCAVFEPIPERPMLRLRDGVGWSDDVVGTDVIAESAESQAWSTIENERSITVSNYETDDRFELPDFPSDTGLVSGITVGVRSAEETWGVLGAYSTSEREFTDPEGTFLRNVANILASAIETHRTRQRLTKAETVSDTIVETSPIGITLTDSDGRNVLTNDRGATDVGRALELLKTSDHDDRWNLLDEDGNPLESEKLPFSRVKETGDPIYDETIGIEHPDGTRVWVSANCVPVTDTTGAFDGAVYALEDVSERKAIEREREANTDTLQRLYSIAADRERSFDEKVDRMLEIGCERLGLKIGYLAKVNEQEDHFGVTHAYGDSENVYPGSVLPLSETYCSRTIEADGVYGFADIETTDEIDDELYDRWELDCYLGREVIVDGRRYGTLCFEDQNPRAEPFTSTEETVVELISQWVSYELERENRERRLQRYVEYTDGILDTIDDVFCVIDEEGRLRRWNESLLDVTGYSETEIESAHVSDLFDTDAETIEAALECGFETGCTRIEAPLRTTDSPRPMYEFAVSTLENPSGETVVAGIGRNITERKERERELTQYERIIETVEDGIFVLDDEYRFESVNDAYLELTGYSYDQLRNEPCSTVVGEEIASAIAELTSESTEAPAIESHLERADGGRVPVESKVTPLPSPEGDREGIVGVVRDSTERKRRERRLEESERRYRTLVEQFPNGAVGLFDEELRFTLAGGQALHTLDATVEDMVGMTIWERYPEKLASKMEPYFRDAIAGERNSFDFEYNDRYLHGYTLPIRDESGTVFTGMVVVQDITERVRSKRRLEELVDELEESNAQLEQFAYAASHDLQEPLRMVSSYLTLIERRYDDVLDTEAKEFIEFAVDGADRMQEMIDGLLEYSRIDTRGDPLEPIDCEEVLADVLIDLEMKIEETDADITIESLPTVYGDPGQLRQLFQNLLDNAITYSDEETPQITVFASKEPTGHTISVRDRGIGIESSDTDRIFEVFNRLHSVEEYAGAGIGLALCQRIAKRHDGRIQVDSEPGEGSTFSISLPTAPDTEGPSDTDD